MKEYEKIKKEITSITTSMEMAGYLHGIQAAAIIFCTKNYPDEICLTKDGESEISIYGLKYYLEREVEEN